MEYKLLDNIKEKRISSKKLNHYFNKETGFSATWGETHDDDPTYSPIGPFIADIEISTSCSGVKGTGVCKFCYKSNTPDGIHMSLNTFITVMKKINTIPTVGQVALGIGDVSGQYANPDLWNIVDWCKENGIVPNITVNGEGVTDEIADMLSSKMGACAVSVYDKNKSYNTIKKLTDRGMTQVNIHQVIHDSNFDLVKEVIDDIKSDERLSKLNAIVFLSLKPKGRGKNLSLFRPLSQEKFNELISYTEMNKVNYGMDSCTAGSFMKAIENHPYKDKLLPMIEPCESTKFSIFVNVRGEFFPCSFMENEIVENGGDWTQGLDVVNCNDFIKDIWMNEKTKLFRNKCIICTINNEGCPHYIIR